MIDLATFLINRERQRAQPPLGGIIIFFYGPQSATEGVYDVGRVIWAPGGEWSRASEVAYEIDPPFRMTTEYNPPLVLPETDSVSRMVRKGLLGVPLPADSKLINATKGDPENGRDATEKYRSPATIEELTRFFMIEMARDGWQREGTSTATTLIFRRGGSMIGIFISINTPGEFSLMGS